MGYSRQYAKHTETKRNDKNQIVSVDIDIAGIVEKAFYAHFFFTGAPEARLFALRPSLAKLKACETNISDEYYLKLNFNSNLDGQGIFEHGRPDLNMVVALDVSGSMGNTFKGENKEKLEVAKQCLIMILHQLKPTDYFGLVTFNSDATVVQPLTKWQDTNVKELQEKIMSLTAGGGTTVSNAMNTSTQLFEKSNQDPSFSKRIFFLTDMEVGEQDGEEFVKLVRANAEKALWSTVVGIGLDLSSKVIEKTCKTPGANYCNVFSTSNFKDLMDKELGYLVTPLAFNIDISLVSDDGISIDVAYGSPEVNDVKSGATNFVISTEFPVMENDKGNKKPAGLVFKLNSSDNSFEGKQLKLVMKYQDVKDVNKTLSQTVELTIPTTNPGESYFEDEGIRKAVLLLQYTRVVKEYMKSQHKQRTGFKEDMLQFMKHYKSEQIALQDDTLSQEYDNLMKVYLCIGGKQTDFTVSAPATSVGTSSAI